MKKQFLACMLTLLLSALTACPALAADMSGSGWSYTGTVLTITGNISDYGLASSRSDWFIGTPFERNGIDHTVTEMIVEEGVTSLGDLAFYGMGNLKKVTLPSTLKSIGSDTFMQCTALTEIRIPASVTFLGHGAFNNCSSLKKITFEGGAPSIGRWDAYYNFNNQSNFIFSGCTADVYYPPYPSWTESKIAEYSMNFYPTWHMTYDVSGSCGNNAKWYIANSDTLIISGSGSVTDFASYGNTPWYSYVNNISSVVVGSGITRIGQHSFNGMENLVSVSLPSTLKELGKYTFNGCKKLASITLPNSLNFLDEYAFEYCSSLTSINLPEGLTIIPTYAFDYCTALSNVTLPSTLKTIDYGAFFGTSSLTSISIPSGTETIGYKAFAWSGLTEATIPTTVTDIDTKAFADCPATLTISCHEGSYAAEFAAAQSITADVEPHDEEILPAIDITCMVDGATEGKRCTICDMTLVEQIITPAPGHSYSEPVFAWSDDGSACTATFTCAACGDVQTPEMTVTSQQVKAPDCVNPGDTQYTATVTFGEETSQNPEMPEETITQPKVYTTQLVLTDLPALGHTEVTIPGIEATCTESGMMDYIFCETCGEELQLADEIPALGHTEAVTLEALAPTCTEEGHTQEISCSVCQTVLTASESIPSLGHTEYVSAAAVAPDCVNTGLTEEISCSVCLTVLTPAETVPALGHTAEIDAAAAPDCINTGLTEGSHCSVCSETLSAQEIVPALGHTAETDAAVPPTDRETGLTEGSHCSVCQTVLTAQEIVPANFTWDGDTVIAYNAAATDVIIPDGAAALGNTLFKGNTAVTTVRVPDSVSAIGTQTFFGCAALTDVWLPDHLTNIGAQTFYNVSARIHATAGSATAIALSYRSVPFTTDDSMTLRYRVTSATGTPTAVWLVGYHNDAESIVLPPAIKDVPLTQILSNAFADCDNLRQITIPASVSVIAADAFSVGNDMLTIVSSADAYARTWAQSNGFVWKHDQHTEEILPSAEPTCTEAGLTEGLRCSVCGEVLVEQAPIPAHGHAEEIDPGYDATCTEAGLSDGIHCSVCGEVLAAQTPIESPGHVVVITPAVPATHVTPGLTEGTHCAGCGEVYTMQEETPIVEIAAVTLPAALRIISEEAFANCPFACLVIPDRCERIEANAFTDCAQLQFLEIPASVTEIDSSAFTGCTNLIIVTTSGSAAEAAARELGITCVIR